MNRGTRCLPLFWLLGASPAWASTVDACRGEGTSIVVDTARHSLWLCESGKLRKRFPIAIGRGGVGKRAQGDNKTPLGDYSLGTPRGSSRFGTFIPIGYPTPEQRLAEMSGGDIGIHGPQAGLGWLGAANLWLDWTQGCIAVTSDAVRDISAWILAERPRKIRIR